MTEYEKGFAAGRAIGEARSAAGLLFVLEAELAEPRFDAITMLEHSDYFIEWSQNYTGKRGSIVRDGEGLYKALHDVGAGQAHFKPSETPTLWKTIGNPADEWPMWSQPIAGVDNFYRIGDKVTHNGKHWICEQENSSSGNSFAPGVWGWKEAA